MVICPQFTRLKDKQFVCFSLTLETARIRQARESGGWRECPSPPFNQLEDMPVGAQGELCVKEEWHQ